MTKTIRIATQGVAEDYRRSLVPLIIASLGYTIAWTQPGDADLVVFGPFFARDEKKFRWVPKPLRPLVAALDRRMTSGQRPLTLFQTGENLRYNHIPCDYALSFDLAVDKPRHHRFPYWMEMVDWAHEGVTGNDNPRFGQLLDLQRLTQPFGSGFMKRPFQAALFASHLQEPRETLFNALRHTLPVTGFGPYFDTSIRHHSASGIAKKDILQDYAFNLCPENSMYPGYYTEKIPEAFMAGCLPITWVDSNVAADFNPNAMLNLAPMMCDGFSGLQEALHSKANLERFAGECLFLERPSIEPIRAFLNEAVLTALQ